MTNNSYTFRLFRKTPSLINGISSSLDFFGDDSTHYKINKTEKEADFDSIYSDWQAVGNDMREALKEYGCQISRKS